MGDWSDRGEELARGNMSAAAAEDSLLTGVVRERYHRPTVAALDQALDALDAQEMLLLLYYHIEGLKLREIAQIVEAPQSPIRRWFQRRGSPSVSAHRVHESTVMRWLEKVHRKISDQFQTELSTKHGLNSEEIEICKAIAAEGETPVISKARGTEINQKD